MKLRKLTAIALALIMCFAALVPSAFAAEISDTPEDPVIHVHGFVAGSLYYNHEDVENRTQLWPPTKEAIMKEIPGAIPALTDIALGQRTEADWERFTDKVAEIAKRLVGDAFGDNNGDMLEGTGAASEYPSEEAVRYRYEHSQDITFRYDWRLAPQVLAEQLHDFIEYVKSATGRDKVNITAHSYGSCVTITYIALYGLDSISGVVLHAPAFLGASYDGELMLGQVAFNGKGIANVMKDLILRGEDGEDEWRNTITALEATGIFDLSEVVTDYIVDEALDMLTEKILVDFFAKWPAIWAMVPDEMYEDARAYIFDDVLAKRGEDVSGLLAKLDEYDNLVRNHRQELLDLIADNVNFGVVAKYDVQKVPITKNSTSLSDNIIDTKAASLGATCADYGTTLPKDYKQAKYPEKNYISPDRMIDASTCMYPERTWFIKGDQHPNESDDTYELFLRILSNDGYTVESDPEYPQFLLYDAVTDSLSPLTAENAQNKSTSGFAKFIEFLKEFFSMLIRFIQNVTKKSF